MAKKEEELIQLVLTQKEAMILCSITSLGLKLLRKDVEGGKITLVILEKIIKTWPSEAITLSGKMLSLITVTSFSFVRIATKLVDI